MFVDGRDANTTDVWLTPPYILEVLGEFDLDPCAATQRPWDTAKTHYTAEDNGLSMPWFGRVWLNPPYGDQLPLWLERLNEHGNGIALITARTETRWFHDLVWERADGILFLKGRLKFYKENGQPGGTATFPSCLVAYGERNADVLQEAGKRNLKGHYIGMENIQIEKRVG